MKQLLAVVAAVAMVLAAVLVRGSIDGDGNDDPSGSGGGSGDGAIELICGPELLETCNRMAESKSDSDIRVSTQDEQATAEQIAADEIELTGHRVWLAAGDWPAIAADGGADMPELASSEVLARSPAVIVARTERLGVIEAECGSVTWSCIGDFAGGPWTDLGGEPGWGRMKVGIPTPGDGEGMVVVNQAVASEVGDTDFATNDLSDPAVETWFDRLATASKPTGSTTPLTEFIRVRDSLSVVGGLESSAVSEIDGIAVAGTLTVVAPEPVATADVQLWAGSEGSLETALEVLNAAGLTDALGQSGWRVPGNDDEFRLTVSADSIGADMRSFATGLPDGSGLPNPGVISAVDTKWENT